MWLVPGDDDRGQRVPAVGRRVRVRGDGSRRGRPAQNPRAGHLQGDQCLRDRGELRHAQPKRTLPRGGFSLTSYASLCPLYRETTSERRTGGLASPLAHSSTPHRVTLQQGFAVGGCAPDVMGMGPSVAVPRLLARHGLAVHDIDLWELNEV